MNMIDFARLSYRRIDLERIRLQGLNLGVQLERNLPDGLQFSYTHVSRKGLSIRMIIQCARVGANIVTIPAAPSAVFFMKEDPMLLTPKPFLSLSLYNKMISTLLPVEYHEDYEEAVEKFDQILASLDTQKEFIYEPNHQ